MTTAIDTALQPIEHGTRASRFLERLFGTADEGKVSIYEPDGEHHKNETTRFALDQFEEVDRFIQRRRDHGPIYFNTAMQTADLPSYKRGGYADVYSTTCLYADLGPTATNCTRRSMKPWRLSTQCHCPSRC